MSDILQQHKGLAVAGWCASEGQYRPLPPAAKVSSVLRAPLWHLQGEPTIPSTLQEELDTNPFLRPSDPNIRHNLGEGQGGRILRYWVDCSAAMAAPVPAEWSSVARRCFSRCTRCGSLGSHQKAQGQLLRGVEAALKSQLV